MSNKMNNLPMFPLNIFLLVGGVTRLRIFEPRYLKMVGLSSSLGGFIISSNAQNGDQPRWGSWVEIINFDKGDDGVLEIDVKCKSLGHVFNIEQDIDKLQFADISEFEHWSEGDSDDNTLFLSESLSLLFKSNVLLNELYQDKLIENGDWVVSRWLELLPIPFDIKNKFIFNSSFVEAENLVNAIISQENQQ